MKTKQSWEPTSEEWVAIVKLMSGDKICSVFYSSRREAAKRAAIWRAAAKAGMRPARIARAFGVTRQAVSKVLHSAPRSKVRLPSRATSHYAGGAKKSTTDLERVKASEARLREALKDIVTEIDEADQVGRGFGTDVIRNIAMIARTAIADAERPERVQQSATR